MTSEQYEELCRQFIAEKFGLPVAQVRSVLVPNPQRPDLPGYKHQIDLYWEIQTDVALYLHIANAKWRGSRKVEQGEVGLLQHVRQKVAAHKALMLSSSGFTAGAVAVAKDEGIGLHVVTPDFDVAVLPVKNRADIQVALAGLASERQPTRPLYNHDVVHRGLQGTAEYATQGAAAPSTPLGSGVAVSRPFAGQTGGASPVPTNRGPSSIPARNTGAGGWSNRGGAFRRR